MFDTQAVKKRAEGHCQLVPMVPPLAVPCEEDGRWKRGWRIMNISTDKKWQLKRSRIVGVKLDTFSFLLQSIHVTRNRYFRNLNGVLCQF